MKFPVGFSGVAVVALTCGAGPVDELVPEPRSAVVREGVASERALQDVRCESGAVEGADAGVAEEAYVLDVGADAVRITASSRLGEMNARKTLDQLKRLAGGKVPCCRIADWPVLRWRGFMVDTGRNYLDLRSLRDLIDVMAAYKLNLLHWHITEYYGWRLQSKRHPEIERKGFFDPSGKRHFGKFYTQEEFRGIVDYAFERGVTVMPEFDMPGHSEAFRRAFGFKSMKDPGVRETMADLIDELCNLAPKEKMPFVHLGGDEVWEGKEKIDEETMTAWAKVVTDNGRTVVGWDPGQKFTPAGPRIAMLWGGTQAKDCGWFDARGWYIEDYDPFEVLGAASYFPPFRGETGGAQRLGAIFCNWHDSAVGMPYDRTFRDVPVFPACVALGDLYWHGRAYASSFVRRRLPLAGDPLLDIAKDVERRVIAQRDKVLTDLRHPFHFVRQTQMRWRLTDAGGRLIAKDIAQGSVFPYYGPGRLQNLTHSPTGTVFMETWIKSPSDRTVGAWIGFTAYDRDCGLTRAWGTPDQGQWNKFGAKVEVNGEPIAPPVWERPSLDGKDNAMLKEVRWAYLFDEIPYTNEEWYMREPTKIVLRKGWNHVRLTLPNTRPVNTWETHRWVGTFMPVSGTTDHPREIEDLEYSSDPR